MFNLREARDRARKRAQKLELQEILDGLHEADLIHQVTAGTHLTPADHDRIKAFVDSLPKPKRPKKGTLRTLIDNTKKGS